MTFGGGSYLHLLLPAMNPTLQGSRERIFSWLTEQRINRHSPMCVCVGGICLVCPPEEMPGHSELQAQFEKKRKAKRAGVQTPFFSCLLGFFVLLKFRFSA